MLSSKSPSWILQLLRCFQANRSHWDPPLDIVADRHSFWGSFLLQVFEQPGPHSEYPKVRPKPYSAFIYQTQRQTIQMQTALFSGHPSGRIQMLQWLSALFIWRKQRGTNNSIQMPKRPNVLSFFHKAHLFFTKVWVWWFFLVQVYCTETLLCLNIHCKCLLRS